MVSPKTSLAIGHTAVDDREYSRPDGVENDTKLLDRKRFSGAITINFFAFLLPALYGTLSKYWISEIDTSMVVTVDTYTYIGVVGEVINEGLPRAAWLVIGDNASRSVAGRVGLAQTLIAFQTCLGLLVSLIVVGAADSFSSTFVPDTVRQASLTYVRISAFSMLSSALEYATSNATRALDRPDVPLLISAVRFLINIVLDLLIVSPFHIGSWIPSVNIQAGVRLSCDMLAALSGLLYFVWIVYDLRKKHTIVLIPRPSLQQFLVLLQPGILTFIESAVRNTLYLWLVANIVSMGSDYATAWGVFNTIRWGLVMVPVQTLEASSLAFTGHRWGIFRHGMGIRATQAKATRRQIQELLRPALIASLSALLVEIPLCVLLSLLGARPYALWVSGSPAVADITAHMWQTIDWCYIFYALSTQLATVLLATIPRWYLYQSLASNLLYVLPWAIVCQVKNLDASNAWFYHSIVFGGSLVVSFVIIAGFVMLWTWKLWRGTLRVSKIRCS